MRMRIFVLCLLLIGFGGANAHAHAMLSSASPPVGGSAGAGTRQVTLSFTQGLEPAFSSVQVTDSKGARVDTGRAQVSGSTMTIGLKALSPGTYRVNWLAEPANRFCPAEYLLDPLADALADRIAGMAGGASVNGCFAGDAVAG